MADYVSSSSSKDEIIFTRPLLLLTINGAMGGFLYGYDTCSMSSSLLQLKQSSLDVGCPGLLPTGLNTAQQQLVTSILVLGGFVGAAGAGPIALHLGRRSSLLVASCIFFVGSVLMASATDLSIMLLARITTGVGVGMASHTVPLYIAECAPTQLRGSLCCMYDIMIIVGQFTAALVSTPFFRFEVANGWRWILGLGALPAVLMFIGFALQPESPRWLLIQDKTEDARKVLNALRANQAGPEAIQSEFNEMAAGVRAECMASSGGYGISQFYRKYIMDAGVRNALLLGGGLVFLQQWCGLNTIMYYGPTVLQLASPEESIGYCFSGQNQANVAYNMLFAIGQLPGAITAWHLIDQRGRKPLILVSTFGVMLSLVFCGFAFHASVVHKPAVITAILVFLTSLGLGLSPVPHIVNAEIFPLPLRAQCLAFVWSFKWMNSFIVSATFLYLAKGISTYGVDPMGHPDGVFWFYGFITSIGFICLFRNMPETNGLTLEQIGHLFRPLDENDTNNSETTPLVKQA